MTIDTSLLKAYANLLYLEIVTFISFKSHRVEVIRDIGIQEVGV